MKRHRIRCSPHYRIVRWPDGRRKGAFVAIVRGGHIFAFPTLELMCGGYPNGGST